VYGEENFFLSWEVPQGTHSPLRTRSSRHLRDPPVLHMAKAVDAESKEKKAKREKGDSKKGDELGVSSDVDKASRKAARKAAKKAAAAAAEGIGGSGGGQGEKSDTGAKSEKSEKGDAVSAAGAAGAKATAGKEAAAAAVAALPCWSNFTDAPFLPPVMAALKAMGFPTPTEIQQHAWPVACSVGKAPCHKSLKARVGGEPNMAGVS